MANYASGVRVICPYFDHEARLSITCEGIVPGSQTLSRFDTPEAKRRWQRCYCETTKFGRCPLAGKLNEKYEEGEQDGNE